MTKNEILYNVGLTEKVYSEQKDIDFKAQRLKLIKWIEDKKTDTQGFVAIKDKTIYIVWRGSSSKKDFQNDASIDKVPFVQDGEKVHIGFKSSWDAVKDETYKSFEKALSTLGGEGEVDNIVVCGHSLGAAVSTLCYDYSVSEDETINLKDGIKDNMVTRIGLQVRFTNAETGVVFGGSGLGEATTKRELTLLSDATIDPIKFNQSTISIATKKALDIACANILDRMIKKGIFTK